MAYELAFTQPYLSFGGCKIIKSDGKIYSTSAKYYSKNGYCQYLRMSNYCYCKRIWCLIIAIVSICAYGE